MLKTQTKILEKLEQYFGKMTFYNMPLYNMYKDSLYGEIPKEYHQTIHEIIDISEAEEKCCE